MSVFKIYESRSCFQCKATNVSVVEFDVAQYEYAICEDCVRNNWVERKDQQIKKLVGNLGSEDVINFLKTLDELRRYSK